jgi:hypothetical protein
VTGAVTVVAVVAGAVPEIVDVVQLTVVPVTANELLVDFAAIAPPAPAVADAQLAVCVVPTTQIVVADAEVAPTQATSTRAIAIARPKVLILLMTLPFVVATQRAAGVYWTCASGALRPCRPCFSQDLGI